MHVCMQFFSISNDLLGSLPGYAIMYNDNVFTFPFLFVLKVLLIVF